ncbi:MAG: LysM peptidoglycan-binding domain-containing protein, partial [Actinomycetota bacterium]
MTEHLSEPYEPRDSEESYDWDYEEERRGPKILWGRVAALGLALVLAFLLGRVTAGGDDDSERVADLRTELRSTQAELEQARDELAAVENEPTGTPATPDETPAEGEGEGEGAAAQTYEVQPGDTLRDIAERFYQDVTFDDCIAEANGITDPLAIRPGDELEIPEESACA